MSPTLGHTKDFNPNSRLVMSLIREPFKPTNAIGTKKVTHYWDKIYGFGVLCVAGGGPDPNPGFPNAP